MKTIARGYDVAELFAFGHLMPHGLLNWVDELTDEQGREYGDVIEIAASLIFFYPSETVIFYEDDFWRLFYQPLPFLVAQVADQREGLLHSYLQTFNCDTTWIWNEVMEYLGMRTYPEVDVPTGSLMKTLLRHPLAWLGAIWWEDERVYHVLAVRGELMFRMECDTRTRRVDVAVNKV